MDVGNLFSPGRHQAIIYTNAAFLNMISKFTEYLFEYEITFIDQNATENVVYT